MRTLFYAVSLIVLQVILSCSTEMNHTDCTLIPETGPCKASIPKYYFDKQEQKCKVFYWGGCDGVVPFETQQDCDKKCPCQAK
mgnify:CR=1 FL=1